MKTKQTIRLAFVATALGALACATYAGEEKEETVSIDKIPAHAAAALKKVAGTKISKVNLEDEDGKIKGYEAAFMVKGRKHEVAVTSEGKVYSIEEEMPLAQAPKVVQAAITKQAAGQAITTVERALEDGKLTYEAMIGKTEYEFAEDGKFIGKEEPGSEKD